MCQFSYQVSQIVRERQSIAEFPCTDLQKRERMASAIVMFEPLFPVWFECQTQKICKFGDMNLVWS
jgi:hypothetical protein